MPAPPRALEGQALASSGPWEPPEFLGLWPHRSKVCGQMASPSLLCGSHVPLYFSYEDTCDGI